MNELKVIVNGEKFKELTGHYDGFTIDVKEITELIEWDGKDFSEFPEAKGVYFIYDEDKEPLYIGCTRRKDGFKGRFKSHHKKELFIALARYIRFVEIVDPTATYLYERIKIHQMEPILNMDYDHSSDLKKRVITKLINKQDYIRNLINQLKINKNNIKNYTSEEKIGVILKSLKQKEVDELGEICINIGKKDEVKKLINDNGIYTEINDDIIEILMSELET